MLSQRQLRAGMFSTLDALDRAGVLWRVLGCIALVLLIAIARTDLGNPPPNEVEHAASSTTPAPDGPASAPRARQFWERDDPTRATASGGAQESKGILDRYVSNLKENDRQKADPDFQLLAACAKGDARAIQNLLDRGANPSFRNTDPRGRWETPLMAAAASGSLDAVRLLLAQKGVDPTVENRDYETAWTYATTSEIRKLLEARGVHR